MNDETIVRNQAKIEAARTNARAVLRLREDGLDALIWSHKPEKTPVPRTVSEIPTSTPRLEALAADLRSRVSGTSARPPRARHDGGHRIGRHSPDRMPPPRLLGTIHFSSLPAGAARLHYFWRSDETFQGSDVFYRCNVGDPGRRNRR